MLAILRIEPLVGEPGEPAAEPEPGALLTDTRSGLVIEPGVLTAVVTPEADEGARLADRLGRFVDDGLVTLGGVPVAQLLLEELRRRIVVSETDPLLFAGRLREELDPWDRASDEQLLAAIAVANAEDVLDSLPEGLDGHMEERGRSLSGGQRQRLVLARALLAEAEILVLVEPTSAVDAHTEARIAQRLHEARRGPHDRRHDRQPARPRPRRPRRPDGRTAASPRPARIASCCGRAPAYRCRRHAGGRRA